MTPLSLGILILGLGIWFLILLFIFLRLLSTKFSLWWKYKIRRKKFDQEQIEWCYNAIDQGKTKNEIIKFLLIKGTPKKKVDEIAYVYDQIVKTLNKQMKGGI